MSTIKEVAKLAGVSVGTVSKVLNNQENIKELNKKRVLAAIKKLNYEPNIHARNLSSGKTNLISIVVPSVGFEFQNIFLTSLDNVLKTKNYDSVIFPLLSRDRLERLSCETNFLYHTDALIISSLSPKSLFKKGKIPTKKPYLIVDSHEECENSLVVDNFLGGYLAGSHLKINKNKKIYLIGGYETDDVFSSGVFKERTKGFFDALIKRNVNTQNVEIENIVLDWNQAFDFGKKVSSVEKNFSVFSVSDIVAWGFIEGCKTNNLIPGIDYHIIGYDDLSFSERIGLTTINQPIDELGTIAANKILDEIAGISKFEKIVLKPKFVERHSN
jgi:LacI family transcriptional regulator